MRKIYFLFLFLIITFATNAAVKYTERDSVIYERYISRFKEDAQLPIGELIVKTALFFRDAPYVASTLDNNPSEQLVINLHQFDCTTFVENCIALSRTLKTGDYSFSNFCNQLKTIRYRDGKIEDYASRLHYVTDWGYNNSKKGILKDETLALGGVSDAKTINFMSKHTDAYKPLHNDIEMQKKIVNIEQQINERHSYYVLKKEDIDKAGSQINSGDVIVFATSIEGLDYSHICIAYRNKGMLSFIHASSKTMRVIVEPQPLSEYCLKSAKCTGISIFRVTD